MNKTQKGNIDKVNEIKNKILNYFPFVEDEKSKSLICRVSSSEQLVLKLFFRSGTVDLFKKETLFGIEKEESIIRSFTFNNEDNVKVLKELVKNREI